MSKEVNFNKNEVFTSRAILDLHGFFLITESNLVVDNPKIIYKGLRVDELYLLQYIEKLNIIDRCTIYEELIRDNVIEIFGYPLEKISTIYSPAGIIDAVAEAVLQTTFEYLSNKNGVLFERLSAEVTYLESMQAIISHYLSIPYDDVAKKSINEIYKLYAVCSQAFPSQVNPLERIEV